MNRNRLCLAILLSSLFAWACAPVGTPPATNTPKAASIQWPTPTPTEINQAGQWGRLASLGFENERIKTTLFFAGQARDGSNRYGCNPASNLQLYTVNPIDVRHLNWSDSSENRDFALTKMVEAGISVVTMSSWGEHFLPCNIGWAQAAPMQTAPGAHDELFAAAVSKHLLIIPFIESRGDWAFRDEFPRWTDGRVAPGTVSQVNDLINRYLKNAAHPEWTDQWAQVYDRNHEPRYAVVIIHASSNQLGPNDHDAFAAGFDLIAEEVLQTTGIKVGFFIDPLPPGTNAPGVLKPSPEETGLALLNTDAILGIQSFIPEIWVAGSPDDGQLIAWKRDFSRRWSDSGIPFLMDISPGYDASIVFPNSTRYGFTTGWRDELTAMVMDFGRDGLTFNSWNGYTEGMAAVPTHEHGDTFYRWLQTACELVDSPN